MSEAGFVGAASDDGGDGKVGSAGWYPDPDDPGGRFLRRWDGRDWAEDFRPATEEERALLHWPSPDPDPAGPGDGAGPGWYPQDAHWLRHWDGARWTDDRRPLEGRAAPRPSSTPPPWGSSGFADWLPPASAPGEWKVLRALGEAKERRDDQALATFWLGVAGVFSLVLLLLTQTPVFFWLSVICGIGAIIISRFVRERAIRDGDATLQYLGRYGQILGWVVIGVFLFIVVIWAIFVGVFIGAASG